MKKIRNILWGMLFIIIGIIVLLNSLEITNIDIFFKGWWTLFIIVPSFIELFKEKEKTWNIFSLIVGIALLLAARGILDITLIAKCILPAILIIIGASIIFKDRINSKVNEKIKEVKEKDVKEYYATFSGQNLDLTAELLDGAKFNAIFGGIDVNLTKANITEDIVLEVCSVFGGVDIKVPAGVGVKVQSNSIFGGVSNKVKTKDYKYTIYVKAMCIFGGCDINE